MIKFIKNIDWETVKGVIIVLLFFMLMSFVFKGCEGELCSELQYIPR